MTKRIFHLVLIKPTRYDEDGYPIQWKRSIVPSNSLACLFGLAEDCRQREVLGPDTDIRIHAIDESNKRVEPERIIQMIRQDDAAAMIGLVGVQSNQFPRAVDLARPFREAGLPVCIGGFHVSGCLSMLPDMPPEIQQAQKMGISFFAGEAEERRLDEVLRDAAKGALKPLYNYANDLPDLAGAPCPILPKDVALRVFSGFSSFDLGRGCPFECSFCCIINVQGRKSRFRGVEDMEQIVRQNHAMGIERMFITDDNFARNKNWEQYFDRLIELRECENIRMRIVIQVDALCHKIPRFIEKASKAGADQIFLGLENINPDNLEASNKRQNNITDYRDMLLAWKKHHAVITAGYIIGFPNDTPESILRDIEIIKQELPIDILAPTHLTPLPGSEDHRNLLAKGEWMDPDLNKYNLNSRVMHHPRMTLEEVSGVYDAVFEHYFSFEHVKTVLRRMTALGSGKKFTTMNRLFYFRQFWEVYGVSAYDGGIGRLKYRNDRRPGLPRENPVFFYAKYWSYLFSTSIRSNFSYWWLRLITYWIFYHPKRFDYVDKAITPVAAADLDDMEIFTETRGGKQAVVKRRRHDDIKEKARKAVV